MAELWFHGSLLYLVREKLLRNISMLREDAKSFDYTVVITVVITTINNCAETQFDGRVVGTFVFLLVVVAHFDMMCVLIGTVCKYKLVDIRVH